LFAGFKQQYDGFDVPETLLRGIVQGKKWVIVETDITLSYDAGKTYNIPLLGGLPR